MAGIASKNLFDLLDDEAPDAENVPKPKTADKSTAKAGKPTAAAPAAKPAVNQREQKPSRGDGERGGRGRGRGRGDRGGERGGYRGDRPPRNYGGEEGGADESRESRGGGRSRGRPREGRGYRENRAATDDRHSKSGISEHEKQAAHGWGGNTGGAEWADEQAGEAIAKADEAEDSHEKAEDAANGDAEPAEPEAKVKSLDDYLAEKAEKKLQLGSDLKTRQANEGANKKWNDGKEFSREGEEENFMIGSSSKKTRERAKKEKAVVELDGEAMRPKDEPTDRRGGRGGHRGGRGRGDGESGGFRGRGDGEFRGRGRGGRGGDRGDFRGRGRGGERGARGGPGGPNISDTNAFPSLGA